MPPRSLLVIAIVATLIAATAAADDLGGSSGGAAASKPPRSAKKPNSPATDASGTGLDQIQFSQPNASPLAPTKSAKATAQSRPGPAHREPGGGVSLDFKWRASNEKVDPYDAVRHTSGPNGAGDGVQGGVKIGF